MSVNHTPGPWTIDEKNGFVICSDNPIADRLICDPSWDEDTGQSWAEVEANCRLIAAAPEMLEALQNMTAMAHVYAGDDPKALALVAKATEVIFKAKGKATTNLTNQARVPNVS
jgi:hypothetical protein